MWGRFVTCHLVRQVKNLPHDPNRHTECAYYFGVTFAGGGRLSLVEDEARGVALQKRGEDADEQALVEAAKRDPARFAELYDLHFERVYAFIARRIGRREEVQDLTADVFHQALAGIGRFEWRGAPFAAWLLRIAANAVIDRGRRLAKERGQPALDVEEIQPESNPIEEVEEQARLFRLVHALPTEQRCVILKRFVEQRSIREIAEQLGRTEGAVKQLQFRALKNLRARLEDANG